MYWTPEGERVLEGAEANLFRYGLLRAIDDLMSLPDDAEFGVRAFDRMTLGQRLTGLYLVASALLDEAAPMIELTQPIEASVAAVYSVIADDAVMEAEIGGSDLVTARTLIVEAMREAAIDECPDPQCSDPGEWQLCVDCLKDLIQFDEDYEDFDDLIDTSPEVKAMTESLFGIAPDYFLHVVDDPPESEIPTLVKKLHGLLGA